MDAASAVSRADLAEAAEFWARRDAGEKAASREVILAKAGEFLASHDTLALATAWVDGDGAPRPRCTPLQYTWLDGSFYVLTEGGRKFLGLSAADEGSRAAVSVFEPYAGFGRLASVQADCAATVSASLDGEYRAVLAARGIPADAIGRLEHPMYLLKLKPAHMDLLFSDLKGEGYGSRQSLDL